VTFDGPLNLTANYANVQLANGTTVVGSSGSGPGTINDTGEDSYLNFDNTQTVSNDTINLGNSSSYDYLYEYDTTGDGQVLTLASSVTVDVAGLAIFYTYGSSGDGIVNKGLIDATTSAGILGIDSSAFTNEGTIDVSGGAEVAISTPFTTTASSLIEIGANSYFDISGTNAWSNLGSITLASGAILIIQAPTSTTGLGSISNSGGTIELAEGNLNNSGDVLDGSSLGLTLAGGTITGGTVSGLAVTSYGGTLSGVTFDGPLILAASSATVHLASGTTVVGSSGSGSGTINATGDSSTLYFDNTQIVSDVTIDLGNVSGDALEEYDTAGAGNQVLTLASSVFVDVTGNAVIADSGYSGDGTVNDGVISVILSVGDLSIDSITFANSGTIDVEDGGEAIIEPTTFTNLSSNKLTGGTYEAQAGSTLEVYSDDTITTDDADIILSGAGSTIETYNTSTGAYGTIDQTLTTIGASGELELLADRDWTTPGAAIRNDGIIELGGGTLTATASGAPLTDAAGSELDGFGTVTTTTFVNSGAIDASGGMLELKGAVTGKGTDTISGAATLEFGAGVSTAKTLGHQDIDFAGDGTLHLLKPAAFYGEISDFAAGDTVELKGSWAFSAISEAAGITTLTLANGSTTHGFEFVGDYTQSDFSITPKATTKIGYA
jgi:hypothetical protein